MVYYRHRRRSRRVRHADDLGEFIAAQNARLSTAAVKAQGTLTASAIANGDTVTIGTRTYTFQDTLTNVAGNVKRSGTLATDLANLQKAIDLTGVSGTDYAAATTVHPTAETLSSGATTLVVRAKTAGASGNLIATTETSATAAWGASALAGGADATTFDTKAKLKKYTADQISRASSAASLP